MKARRKAAMGGKSVAPPIKSRRKPEAPAPAEAAAAPEVAPAAAPAEPAAGEPTPPTA